MIDYQRLGIPIGLLFQPNRDMIDNISVVDTSEMEQLRCRCGAVGNPYNRIVGGAVRCK